jgi:hypothetical protein
MEFIYFVLLLAALSLSLTFLFGFKSLESLFIALFSSVMMVYILTYLIALSIAVYITCALITAGFIFSIIYSIRKKRFIEDIKTYFNSPALWLLFVCSVFYAIVISGAQPIGNDDFNFWAYTPKAILKFDGFALGDRLSSGGQTYGLPIYYAFVSFITGFKFDVLLVAEWLFVWICLLLPFAKYKARDTGRVAVYAFIIFAIILSDYRMHQYLYSDIAVFSIFAGVVGYFYTHRESKARKAVIISGLFFMPHVKEWFGLFLTIFVLMFMVLDGLYRGKGKIKKDSAVFLIINCIIFVFSFSLYKLSEKIITQKSGEYYSFKYLPNTSNQTQPWCNLWSRLMTFIKSPEGILVFFAALILLVIGIIFIYKKRKKLAIASICAGIVCFALFIVMIHVTIKNGTLYYCLDYNSLLLLRVVPYHISHLKYLDIPFWHLVSAIAVLCAATYIFLLKKEQRKYFLLFIAVFLLQSLFVYSAIVIDFAKKNVEGFILSGTALVRYLGVIVYFPLFLIPIYLIGKEGLWKKVNKKIIAVFMLASIILISVFTAPNPMKIQQMRLDNLEAYEKSLQPYERLGSLVEDKKEKQDKVCIIFDLREENASYSSVRVHMKYFTMISYDYMVTLDSTREQDAQIQKLADFISANEITKVLYKWVDDDFNQAFSELFINPDDINGDCICEVAWEGDSLKLRAIATE